MSNEQTCTYQAAERAARKGEHVAGERRRADDHDAQATAHALAHLAEHQLVPDGVPADYAPAQPFQYQIMGVFSVTRIWKELCSRFLCRIQSETR
jgi:hypothetical protein